MPLRVFSRSYFAPWSQHWEEGWRILCGSTEGGSVENFMAHADKWKFISCGEKWSAVMQCAMSLSFRVSWEETNWNQEFFKLTWLPGTDSFEIMSSPIMAPLNLMKKLRTWEETWRKKLPSSSTHQGETCSIPSIGKAWSDRRWWGLKNEGSTSTCTGKMVLT